MRVHFNMSDLLVGMHVIGIHTHMGAVAMAMQIDHLLELELSAAPNFQLPLPNGDLSVHRNFFYLHPVEDWQVWLIENKGSATFRLKTKPSADYFLVLNAEVLPNFLTQWAQNLKTCNAVNMAYVLPDNYLKKCHWLPELKDQSPPAFPNHHS